VEHLQNLQNLRKKKKKTARNYFPLYDTAASVGYSGKAEIARLSFSASFLRIREKRNSCWSVDRAYTFGNSWTEKTADIPIEKR